MKISVVISIKNRTKLFRRSLKLYNKQTMPKNDWELVVVDDMSDEDVLDTLREHAGDINWQYIRMDSNLNDFPIYWGPSLSNNVGFKASRGDVIAIAGPEIMIDKDVLDISYNTALQNVSAFGHVLFSHNSFVKMMDLNPNMEDYSFKKLFSLPTAKNGYPDITKDNFYWFWVAVKKEFILQMGGCDENFMKGICGDDDDFADRLKLIGATPIHKMQIKAIHQEHLTDDKKDTKRIRNNSVWEVARKINTKYLEEKRKQNITIANVNRDWGSNNLIIEKVLNAP